MNSFTGGLLPGAYWKADSGKPWMLYGQGKPSLFVGLILFACAHCICLSKDVFLAQQRLRLLGELQVTQQRPPLLWTERTGNGGLWRATVCAHQALHGASCGWGTKAVGCRSSCSRGRPDHLLVVTGGDGGMEVQETEASAFSAQ